MKNTKKKIGSIINKSYMRQKDAKLHVVASEELQYTADEAERKEDKLC